MVITQESTQSLATLNEGRLPSGPARPASHGQPNPCRCDSPQGQNAAICPTPCRGGCKRELKARRADLGGAVLPGSPADFGKLIAEETEKWAKVVKFSGVKPD
jgi:hypothetical protein